MPTLSAPLPDPRLRRRLQRLAVAVRALILFGALGFVGSQLWSWSSPERALALLQHGLQSAVHVGARQQVAGALLSLLPAAVLLLALHRLWRVFDEYARGRVFSQRALVGLRGFARWLLVDAFV